MSREPRHVDVILLGVTRDGVLGRVDDDLSLGHTQLAINRLTMAVKATPSDLLLRGRLSGLHRQTGNWAEAGRWGYFEEPVDERCRQAFEKAWSNPRAQRDALRWTRADDDPEVVSTRLEALEARAASEPSGERAPVESPRDWGCLIAAVLVSLFLLGVATGVVTLVRWVA